MRRTIMIGATLMLAIGIGQTPTIEASAATQIKYVSITNGSNLNVRKSASTKATTLGKLQNNTKVTVISTKNGWSKIKYKKGYGYVASSYLTSKKPTLKPSSTVTYYVSTPGIDLNVRKSPSSQSQKLGTIKNKSKIDVVSYGKEWSKIRYKTGYAYVATMYLTKNKPALQPSTTTVYYVKTNGIALNVRKSASSTSTKLGSLKDQTKVDVVSYGKEWSKIRYQSGYGYVASSYLTKQKPVSESFQQMTGTYYANPGLTTNLNVRTAPSTTAKKIGEIKQNTKLHVLAQSDAWAKINYNGKTAYVSKDYVSKEVKTNFLRNQNRSYEVYDVEENGTIETIYQKQEKGIVKWGNVNRGFTHTETATSKSYTFFNYHTGYGFAINTPIFKGATSGSLTKGYSKITSVSYTMTVKAGTFKQVVVQKFYNSKGTNTKIVYYAPNAGVIKAVENGHTTFELVDVD
ncbi:SH3 domain-containing protein [Kurthia gibsonii]|uniref:SH3 domain-containing protein n=1 Tax=Kurthia gibsonii TaxID=33946 RepID=UPI0034CFE1C8